MTALPSRRIEMAYKKLIVALSMFAAASPVAAIVSGQAPMIPAPPAGADARYCLHVAPVTGSLVETVQCWTRAEWADQGVDVDKEWAKEGVAVIA
jgi:hypothetical protein